MKLMPPVVLPLRLEGLKRLALAAKTLKMKNNCADKPKTQITKLINKV